MQDKEERLALPEAQTVQPQYLERRECMYLAQMQVRDSMQYQLLRGLNAKKENAKGLQMPSRT